jgi:EAL domain-containing protein (putative c-di-GMP-specific phosphodiesterase class I)/CheY-like chemotaxis protein
MNGPPPIAALPAPSCWVVMGSLVQAAPLAATLAAAGWQVGHVSVGVAQVRQALDAAPTPPDVLLMALDFEDGDGLQLIRLLGRARLAPAVFVLSHQQRAVIRAALRLAEACGVHIAGSAEQPVPAADVVQQLAAWWAARRPAAPTARPPVAAPQAPPLDGPTLRQLLADGGLQAWFQPQLRLDTREIVGVEALMRAQDAQGHWIMPDRLLPGLAAHGLMEAATLEILRQTAAFTAGCIGHGLAISASVNASLRSMSDLAFCRQLPQIVAQAGLDPCWITIEVTESDTTDDLADVIENTARIRMLGFNLAIDDFGVAYSSLSQLSFIPFSELKIDRAFVQGLHLDATRRGIVQGCATLGRLLRLEVVAEGVETPEELAAVAAAGCTRVQGYLVARPMPAAAMRDWLDRWPELVWQATAP